MNRHAEKHGSRTADLLYSSWHRPASITRYVDTATADSMQMINIDALLRCERWSESCNCCQRTLVLIETAIDTGQAIKPATVTAKLARDAGCTALCVLVTPNHRDWNQADDIDQFRVKRIHPNPHADWHTMQPRQYADLLVKLRSQGHHDDDCHVHEMHNRREAA